MAETSLNLFGDSLNPKQVLQKRLAQSISESQDLFKKAPPSQMMGATLGATLGGLFGNVLMEKGVIPESPEFAKAKKMEQAKSEVDALAKEAGVSITDDPVKYFSLAADRLANIGMEAEAIKAVEIINLYDARKRAKELETAKIGKEVAETGLAKERSKEASRLKKTELLEEPQPDGKIRYFYQQGDEKIYVGSPVDRELVDKEHGVNRRADRNTELKLADDYARDSKPFLKVKPIYEAQTKYLFDITKGGKPTPAGDATLGRAYLRMIDDRINVSDKKDLDQFQTIFGRVKQGITNTLFEGKLLDDDVRKEIYDDIARNFDAVNDQQIQIEDNLVETTAGYKLNPRNVVRTPYAIRRATQGQREPSGKEREVDFSELPKRGK